MEQSSKVIVGHKLNHLSQTKGKKKEEILEFNELMLIENTKICRLPTSFDANAIKGSQSIQNYLIN